MPQNGQSDYEVDSLLLDYTMPRQDS